MTRRKRHRGKGRKMKRLPVTDKLKAPLTTRPSRSRAAIRNRADAEALVNQAIAIEARKKHFGIAENEAGLMIARSPEAGSFVGRLFITGEISAAQYEAAKWWAGMESRMRRALGLRRLRDSCDFSVRGLATNPEDQRQIDAERTALGEWRAMREAVRDPSNPMALWVLQRAIAEDRPVWQHLGGLRVALNALVRFRKIPLDLEARREFDAAIGLLFGQKDKDADPVDSLGQ